MRVPTMAIMMIVMFFCTAAQLHAQTTTTKGGKPLNESPSREVLQQAAGEGCDGASVVVTRCAPAPTATPAAPTDSLSKSRERAKAAFDRRDRRARQEALDNKTTPAQGTGATGEVQRGQAVTVTSTASDAPPPTVEEVLQKALNPPEVNAAGNTVTYGPDGERRECQAHCTGPMCCKVMRALPNPAQQSNSIGR